jgi:hypothetical protein
MSVVRVHTPSTHGPNAPVFSTDSSTASDSESRGRRPRKRELRRRYVEAVSVVDELDPAAAAAIRRYVGRLREDDYDARARIRALMTPRGDQ